MEMVTRKQEHRPSPDLLGPCRLSQRLASETVSQCDPAKRLITGVVVAAPGGPSAEADRCDRSRRSDNSDLACEECP